MAQTEIDSISEAFSTQPSCYKIGCGLIGGKLAKITEEKRTIEGNGQRYRVDYYVGYDEHFKILFECRKETMNVFYK